MRTNAGGFFFRFFFFMFVEVGTHAMLLRHAEKSHRAEIEPQLETVLSVFS